MPPSFGLVPELTKRIKDKRSRYNAYQQRSVDSLKIFKRQLDCVINKDHTLVEIN